MEKYDLIYSYEDAITHTEMKTTMLQRVIEWLKPSGTAVLDLGEL
jgi:2-polyprenyl-3-methyl-5-hydroxy-6-metoxy-1,4-benzoquinol methylase